jgi:hypothetical protein
MRDRRSTYEDLVETLEVKRQFAIFTCRWEDNIKMAFID